MKALGGWCFRHRRAVLGLWVLALVLSAVASQAAGSDFSSKFTLSHTESASAISLLQKDFPAAAGSSDQIVFSTTSGTVRDAAVQQRVEAALKKVSTMPYVRSIGSPYAAEGANQISKDETVEYATLSFDGQVGTTPVSAIKQIITAAKTADNGQLSVSLGGQDIEQVQRSGSGPQTIIGILLALVVLGVAFGALFATFLPLITALFAIAIGYSLTGLISHTFSVASFATVLGVLIGLGVGVDYSLFIVTRHRNGLKAGRPLEESAGHSINTAGRAVFFAGLTVCIALLGQFALGLPFLYGVAVSATITVLLTMLSSLTLLPALLGFVGERVLSKSERRSLAEDGPHDEASGTQWLRWARFLERHPAIPAFAAIAVVIVIALPVFTLRLGLDDASSDASGTTTRTAYEQLVKGFGPGFSGPLQLVGELQKPSDAAAFGTIVQKLSTEPGIVSASKPIVSPNGEVAIANLVPSTGPQTRQTTSLVNHLRHDVLPQTEAGSGVHVLVGGSTAIQVDFAHKLSSKLVPFVAVVVVLGFLLLMAVFRSLLVPLVASAMNLLSVGASLGIMNAVFEWGYGHSLFGISTKAPVEVFIPVLMISILFGLSMDYEVFLVSRIHEEWVHRRNNAEAVTRGQAETGRVITAAALIMILVFASFALGDDPTIKQFGIGLAGAIIVDAFIVRTVIVPGLMQLIGRANWWLPGWLDRALPQLNVEGADTTEVDPRESELAKI